MKCDYLKIWKEVWFEVSFLLVSVVITVLSLIFSWHFVFPLGLILLLVSVNDFLEQIPPIYWFFRMFSSLKSLPAEKIADWVVFDADEDERIIFLWFIQKSSRTEIVRRLWLRSFYYLTKSPEKYAEVAKMFMP